MEKRAVVIGINYSDTSTSLRGCIDDANRVASMLKGQGYTVLLMTDKIKPSYDNIFESFSWLLHDCSKKSFGKTAKYKTVPPGTKLYFHFSGHGGQVLDRIPDEPDKLEEAIITYDNKKLYNDTIYKHLIKKIPEDVKLRGTMDCCNSRTNFDLRWNMVKFLNSFAIKKTGSGRNSYCDAIIISGASSDGKSYDTIINGVRTGVLTYYYLEIMKEYNYSISADILLDRLQKKIRDNGYHQSPGICFGKYMDIDVIYSL